MKKDMMRSVNSDRFSFPRLWKLFCYDWAIYKRGFLVTNLVVLGICLFPVTWVLLFGTDMRFEDVRQAWARIAYSFPYIISAAFSFYAYYVVNNKVNAVRTPYYVQIPATLGEKYVLLLFELVALSLYAFVGSVVTVGVMHLVCGASLGSFQEAVFGAYSVINIDSDQSALASSLLFSLSLYVTSLFFFFSIKFRKLSVALLLSVLAIYTKVYVLVMIFSLIVGSFEGLGVLAQFKEIDSTWVMAIGQLVLYLLAALFFWLGFHALSNKQVK